MNTSSQRPIWLIIFADLIALLLAFFVMLFATQRVAMFKWSQLVDALSQSFNRDPAAQVDRPSAAGNIGPAEVKRAIDLAYLHSVLVNMIADDAALGAVRLRKYDDRLVIGLPGDFVFEPGSSEPTADARRTLFSLGGVLRNLDNRIDVYGHTDPTPVQGGRHPTNWDLSIARAVAVVEAMRRAGYRSDIAALGYGSTRFDDLSDAGSRQRSYMLARRVELVVHPNRGHRR